MRRRREKAPAKVAKTRGGKRYDRDDPLSPAAIAAALRGMPVRVRSSVEDRIAEARRRAHDTTGHPDPMAFGAPTHDILARQERRWPLLAPVVAAIEREATRAELARLRESVALELRRTPSAAPDIPAGVNGVYEYRRNLANPVFRARVNRRGHLEELSRWSQRGIAVLDAGKDATYAVARA